MAKSPEYPVEVNVDKQRTYVRGEEAKLTPKEFHVLLLLAERGGKITSRQDSRPCVEA